jgi:hypothetical protein
MIDLALCEPGSISHPARVVARLSPFSIRSIHQRRHLRRQNPLGVRTSPQL